MNLSSVAEKFLNEHIRKEIQDQVRRLLVDGSFESIYQAREIATFMTERRIRSLEQAVLGRLAKGEGYRWLVSNKLIEEHSEKLTPLGWKAAYLWPTDRTWRILAERIGAKVTKIDWAGRVISMATYCKDHSYRVTYADGTSEEHRELRFR